MALEDLFLSMCTAWSCIQPYTFGLLDSQEYVRAFQVPHSHLFPEHFFSLRFWFTYWFPTVLSITLGQAIPVVLCLFSTNRPRKEAVHSGRIWVKLNKDKSCKWGLPGTQQTSSNHDNFLRKGWRSLKLIPKHQSWLPVCWFSLYCRLLALQGYNRAGKANPSRISFSLSFRFLPAPVVSNLQCGSYSWEIPLKLGKVNRKTWSLWEECHPTRRVYSLATWK